MALKALLKRPRFVDAEDGHSPTIVQQSMLECLSVTTPFAHKLINVKHRMAFSLQIHLPALR